MLSNCRVIENTNEKIILEFVGQSMTNFTSLELAEESILCHDEKGSTILRAEIKCCLETVLNGATDIEGKSFLSIGFFDEAFIANIKLVNRNYVMFTFLTPFKSLFPDQYLRVTEIKSLHLVNDIKYNMIEKGGRQC